MLLGGCSNKGSEDGDIESTSAVPLSTSTKTLNYFIVEEIFPQLYTVWAAARHQNGFFSYASLMQTPETMRFYFYDLEDGNLTGLEYTLPNEVDLYSIRAMEDGRIFISETVWGGTDDVPGDSYRIHLLSEDGLTLLIEGLPNTAIMDLVINEHDEMIYVHALGAEGEYIVVYSTAGERLAVIEHDGRIGDIVFSEQEGRLFLSENFDNTLRLLTLEKDSYLLQEVMQINNVPHVTPLYPSKTHSFFIDIDFVLYGFDFEAKLFDPILDWRTIGIPDFVLGIMPYEKHFIVLTMDLLTHEPRFLKLTETNQPLELGAVLRLATLTVGRDERLEAAVDQFNRANPQYFIEIVNYSVYGDEAITRLNMDIITGNAPDIFQLTDPWDGTFLPVRQYIAQGLLKDLAPFMERDFDFDDFLKPALRAMYIEGRCYFVVPNFSIRAISGTSAVIGEIENSTLSELLRFLQEDSSRAQSVFGTTMTQFEFIEYILFTHLDHFVNYGTNTANFSSDAFIALLETAKALTPYYQLYNDWARMAYGTTQMVLAQFGSAFSIGVNAQALGGDHSITGFPSVSGNGSGTMLVPGAMFAISANSQYPEAAWSFLQRFYSDAAFNFSLCRTIFESGIELFKAEIDEFNGLAPHWILYADDPMSGPRELLMPALPREIALEAYPNAMDLINMIDRLYLPDENILQIVFGEIPAFLHGDKTAEETARVIQNRVQTYLHELS